MRLTTGCIARIGWRAGVHPRLCIRDAIEKRKTALQDQADRVDSQVGNLTKADIPGATAISLRREPGLPVRCPLVHGVTLRRAIRQEA
jgi:hypothetical protein